MTSLPGAPRQRVLLLGREELARRVEAAAAARGARVRRLHSYNDRELRRELADADAVAVVSRSDAEALRSALLVEHIRPGVPLVATVFDRTVAEQLRSAVPGSRVLSLGDAVTPPLVSACLDGTGATRGRRSPRLRATLRPVDASGRLLLCGLAGLSVLLALDVGIALLVLREPIDRALYAATNVLGTIGPNQAVADGPSWVRLVSSLTAVLTLASAAAFTAGLVDRVSDRRLLALIGARTPPRRNHVIVVGLGQVGLRLCLELRRRRIPVIAIERDGTRHHVSHARRAGIPVVVGHGEDRQLLTALGVRRARALAAVTSTDTTNVAVSVASAAIAPELNIVLRAGDDELAAETRFLFHIGTVLDANRVAADRLAELVVALAAGPQPVQR